MNRLVFNKVIFVISVLLLIGCNSENSSNIQPINKFSNLEKNDMHLQLEKVYPNTFIANFRRGETEFDIYSVWEEDKFIFKIKNPDGSNILEYDVQNGNITSNILDEPSIMISLKDYEEYMILFERKDSFKLKALNLKLGKQKELKYYIDLYQKLFETKEIRALPYLSREIALLRLNGNSSPSVKIIHMLSLLIGNHDGQIEDDFVINYSSRLPPLLDHYNFVRDLKMRGVDWYTRVDSDGPWYCNDPYAGPEFSDLINENCTNPDCVEYLNREDDCPGMCGNGCNCWEWVCGDCCSHNFCRQHDDCGRESVICQGSVWWHPGILAGWLATSSCN